MLPSALTFAAAFALIALAGAWLFDLARSRWGERHPQLRELALCGAFTIGVVIMAATVTLPGRVAWAVITSGPPTGEVPERIG